MNELSVILFNQMDTTDDLDKIDSMIYIIKVYQYFLKLILKVH